MLTLINLIGEQTAPNFIAARQYKADKIINIRSKDTINASLSLKKAFGEMYFDEDIEVNDPFDINEINKAVRNININTNDEYIFNFTGGTKPMSIALYEEYFYKNIKGIYVDSQHKRILEYTRDTVKPVEIDCKISIKEHFKMYGHTSKPKPLKDDKINKETKEKLKIFLKDNYHKLKHFISDFAEEYNRDNDYFKTDSKFKNDISDNYIKWTKEGKELELNILDNNFKLFGNSTHKYFTGFWFEELVQEKFQEGNPFDEVAYNLVVEKKDRENKEQEAEFDIVAVKKHELYIFEVKSGTFLKDYIHKLASNKNFLSNFYAKMYFITFDELEKEKNDDILKFFRIENISYNNLSKEYLEQIIKPKK